MLRLPRAVAKYCWGEAFWPALHVAGSLRYCVVLHLQWLVNSAAHFFGDHPYDNQSWPAENPFVSLAAIGEGWHNWHHKYRTTTPRPSLASRRSSTRPSSSSTAARALGLVTNRKRATGAWNRVKAQKGTPKEHQQNLANAAQKRD